MFFLIALLIGIVHDPGGLRQPNDVLLFFLHVAFGIWLCVGVAWSARGCVRYLRR
jgi:hypothetical protein